MATHETCTLCRRTVVCAFLRVFRMLKRPRRCRWTRGNAIHHEAFTPTICAHTRMPVGSTGDKGVFCTAGDKGGGGETAAEIQTVPPAKSATAPAVVEQHDASPLILRYVHVSTSPRRRLPGPRT